ncbi:MAG: hypothetical protein AAF170_02640 [Bacteroidota bacterium]
MVVFSRQLVVVVLALVASGCAHTQIRTFDPNARADRADVNADARRDRVAMTLVNGERIRTTTLRVDAYEATWVDARTGEPHSVSLSEVQSIRVRNRRRFVLRDAALGAVAGLAMGPVLPQLDRNPNTTPPLRFQIFVTGLSTTAGTVLGGSLGYRFGRTRYVLAPTDSASAHPPSGAD